MSTPFYVFVVINLVLLCGYGWVLLGLMATQFEFNDYVRFGLFFGLVVFAVSFLIWGTK